MSFLLQSKSSRLTVPRHWNLKPSSRVSVVVLQVSQLRSPRHKRSFKGTRTTTPVWTLQGAYIGADLGACRGLGNVIYFGPLSNGLYWRMRSTATPCTNWCASSEADSGAVVNHVIKASATNRLWACLLTRLRLRTGGDRAIDWFGSYHLCCWFSCEKKQRRS